MPLFILKDKCKEFAQPGLRKDSTTPHNSPQSIFSPVDHLDPKRETLAIILITEPVFFQLHFNYHSKVGCVGNWMGSSSRFGHGRFPYNSLKFGVEVYSCSPNTFA